METVYDSYLSVFKIDDTGGNLRDVSDFVTSVDGLPGERALNEATPLVSQGRKYHPTLENAPFTVELMYSEDANTGTDTVFGPLRTHTSPTDFEYYPRGASGKKYWGQCWVRNYIITTRVGNLVTARVDCQVNGQVSRT